LAAGLAPFALVAVLEYAPPLVVVVAAVLVVSAGCAGAFDAVDDPPHPLSRLARPIAMASPRAAIVRRRRFVVRAGDLLTAS
jgi:hypothetical protein